eukprot:TRINITY_DN2110_c1_g1_i1.p1 TRINITY_DN2110_c1_g1~~TRINITY_DN2110_c1_g1_i1.p1  ORF type:complete len:490 (+),score=45.39 TRINITY_DN2110_c1_g1_i1:120-1589(+)
MSGNRNRQQRELDFAIRNAAHFANFIPDAGDDEAANVHVGGTNARDLGMFSTAMQLEQERERAIAIRENRLGESNQQNIKAADFAANLKEKCQWKPTRDPELGPPLKKNRVSTLGSLLTNFVSTHIEHVETLYGVPEDVKSNVGLQACKQRKLTGQTVGLFTEDEPTHVCLPNVSDVDRDSMNVALETCLTHSLLTLELGFCGYGFGRQATEIFKKKGPLTNLQRLSLQGAYQLQDSDVITLLEQMPNINHLSLVNCQLLNGEFLQKLPSKVSDLDVSGCRGIEGQYFEKLFGKQKFTTIKLNTLPVVSDKILNILINTSKKELQLLSVDFCKDITDDGFINAIQHGKQLRSLNCDRVTKLTDKSIEALVQHCTLLQDVSFRNCFRLTDEGLSKLATNNTIEKFNVSKIRNLSSLTITALSNYCNKSLKCLDISFCTKVSDKTLGRLVDKCTSLEQLRVFGCSQLSKSFFWGHSNQIVNIEGSILQIQS